MITRAITFWRVHVSYDVAVIQWIKSFHKNLMITCDKILARTCNSIDNDHVRNAFSYENNVHFEGDGFIGQ